MCAGVSQVRPFDVSLSVIIRIQAICLVVGTQQGKPGMSSYVRTTRQMALILTMTR